MDVMGKIVVRQLARHLGEAVVGQETALQILEQAVMTALATVFVVPSGVMRMTTRTKAIWRLASRHPCHATIGQWRMAHWCEGHSLEVGEFRGLAGGMMTVVLACGRASEHAL